MKKFFEKHDLFKLVGIMMLIAALLTWILVYSVYQGGELMWFNEGTVKPFSIFDSSTIGIFDFNTYILLGLYYFTNVFVFLFVVFGFYKVIGSTESYKAIVNKIAELFKGKELLFVVISIVFYTIFGSISTTPLILFAFIPFSLSVLNRLKLDKITALMATFGGTLLGILGSTYSGGIVGNMINYGTIGIQYGYEFWSIIILTVIAIIVLSIFLSMRIKSTDKKELVEDIFSSDEDTKKKTKKVKGLVPMAILLGVFAVVIILAFITWSAFGVETFTKLHETITNATIGGEGKTFPIMFIGSSTLAALGEWDLFTAGSFMVFILILIKLICNIKTDEVIENIGEGLKLAIKPAVLLIMVYTVLVFSVSYPVIPGVINTLMNWLSADVLRPIAWLLSGFITSLFAVDMQYVTSVIGSLFAKFSNANAAALALQASYAIFGFIAPTSAILMLGLSTLNIKFKDYFKFIWKFLLALVAIVLIVLYILLYI